VAERSLTKSRAKQMQLGLLASFPEAEKSPKKTPNKHFLTMKNKYILYAIAGLLLVQLIMNIKIALS